MIQFTYDEEAKAIYVVLSDKSVTETVDTGHGLNVDYDAEGNRVGVEVLL